MHRFFYFAVLVGMAVPAPGLAGDGTVEAHLDMDVLPEVESSSWLRVGGSHAFLLDDGTLVINDNDFTDHISYQTQVGEIDADDHVEFTASVRVISNLGGDAVTMGVARVGIKVSLHLYPDRVVLTERVDPFTERELGQAAVDLADFRQVTLRKASAESNRFETITVLVDGAEVIQAKPTPSVYAQANMLSMGSTSETHVGASLWDWVSYRIESQSGISTSTTSFGRVKAAFGPR